MHALLKTINQRVEKLVDKDHVIGHSYLMSVKDVSGLKYVFQNKIIPLLQEYFYGDFGKIGLVIGKGFFENEGEQEIVKDNFFAEFNDYHIDDRPIYHLKNVLNMSEQEFINAIELLMK